MSKPAEYTPDQIGQIKVMVVDDDAMVRTIIIEYLRRFGFVNIFEAKNGDAAIKELRQPGSDFDLVISDWEMPKVNGITLLKAVKGPMGKGRTRFIMITSQISQERFKVSRAIHLDVDGYIVKPFKGDTLRKHVFMALGWPVGDEKKKAG